MLVIRVAAVRPANCVSDRAGPSFDPEKTDLITFVQPRDGNQILNMAMVDLYRIGFIK